MKNNSKHMQPAAMPEVLLVQCPFYIVGLKIFIQVIVLSCALRILPVAVLGSWDTMAIARGTL